MSGFQRIGGGPKAASAFAKAAESGESSAARTPSKTIGSSLTLRLSTTERTELERLAAGQSLSAFVRAKLFGKAAIRRQKTIRTPIADHRALARVLSALGKSSVTADLARLHWASATGTVNLDIETTAAVQRACTEIATMRQDLVRALGLRSD
ncbi:MAG: hypothetical protein AAGI03_13835 [Pseudomonadota bacterium]